MNRSKSPLFNSPLAIAALLFPALLTAAESTHHTSDFSENGTPQWALQLSGAPDGMGTQSLTQNSDATARLYGISTQLDFQPMVLQFLGVIGAGPILTAYPVGSRSNTSKSTLMYAWSGGGQIRYQARFWERQILVPNASYSVEGLNYRLRSGEGKVILSRGPSLGFSLLLNTFDYLSSREFFSNYGISKTFMTAEYRIRDASDSFVSLQERSFHLGIRFEL